MTKFIAEISSNHNRSWERTYQLIQEAKRIGCWAVKFQLFEPELLYHSSFTKQIQKMKTWALPKDFIPEIKVVCNDLDIDFGMSVFDLESLEFAKDYVDFLKVGSYELQYLELIKAVAKTGKKWMISTGMESFDINNFMRHIRAAEIVTRIMGNPPSVIFACNSNYPAKPENANLVNINKFQNYFQIPAGWSDHTVHPGVIYKAIACGAEYIEFHFDMRIDRQYGVESEIGHCWYPDEIENVIQNVRIGELVWQSNDTGESEASKWRTDPEDGLRPLKKYREELLK